MTAPWRKHTENGIVLQFKSKIDQEFRLGVEGKHLLISPHTLKQLLEHSCCKSACSSASHVRQLSSSGLW
jgi:hypothetical protein